MWELWQCVGADVSGDADDDGDASDDDDAEENGERKWQRGLGNRNPVTEDETGASKKQILDQFVKGLAIARDYPMRSRATLQATYFSAFQGYFGH